MPAASPKPNYADRVPPQAVEMEQATLGSMLISSDAVRRVREILRAEDFYRDAHRIIFEAIAALSERGDPVDVLTVQDLLRLQDFLESCGGANYLVLLTNAVVTPSNAEYYARAVEDAAVRRRLLASATMIESLAHSDCDDIGHLVQKAGEVVAGASVVRSRVAYNRPMLMKAGCFLKAVGEPPPMLVQQILPDRSLVILSGKPKGGKSLAALDMADCICTGKPVWGLFDVNRAGAVLYLGMEDGRYEIANRLLKRGLRADDDRNLYICPERFALGTAAGVQALKSLLRDEEIAPVLVVVDTAAEALGITDWSNRGEVSDKMRMLREFCREVCSVLLIAHNRKAAAEDSGDEIAGTNAFTGAADGWLSVTKVDKAKDHHRLSMNADGRGGMRANFVLEMDFTTTAFHALSEEEVAEHTREQQALIRKQKYEAVAARTEQSDKGATMGQIADAIGEEIRNTQVIVKEMVQKSLIELTGEQLKVGSGRPAPLYRLTDKGRTELTNKRISESSPYRDSLIGSEIPGPSSTSSNASQNGTSSHLDDFFGGLTCEAGNGSADEVEL